MTKPDRTLIAEVMLFSQGFSSAGKLSEKLVPLFKLCQEQLSPQSHYDFTLRALKSVLVSAGNVKRLKMKGELIWERDFTVSELALSKNLFVTTGAEGYVKGTLFVLLWVRY